jgi:hypothetical protein
MKQDPIVEQVRAVRKAIAAECGNDPAQYAAHLRDIEKQYAARIVSFAPRLVIQQAVVAEERAPYGSSTTNATRD